MRKPLKLSPEARAARIARQNRDSKERCYARAVAYLRKAGPKADTTGVPGWVLRRLGW